MYKPDLKISRCEFQRRSELQAGLAKATVLTCDKSTDENTLDEPTEVAPKTQAVPVASPNFRHTFPGNSVTVMRLK
jgi:alpha-L-arabinofuranosidase